MKKTLFFSLVLVVVLGSASLANAGVIFYDNFNQEVYGLNYTEFDNWNVTDGTVDVVGEGTPHPLSSAGAGYGLFVDLDGSTKDAGILTTKEEFSLVANTVYTLSFDLAGNQRDNSSDEVTVTFGLGDFSETFTMNASDPFAKIVRQFTVDSDTSGYLSFSNFGGDNVGALLDNVQLSVVPEPATIVFGLFGITGFFLKRKFF